MLDLNCSIYLSPSWSEELLIKEVYLFLGGEKYIHSCISTKNYELTIDKNDSADEKDEKDFPDGFLYFKYILYLDFLGKNSKEFCVTEVSRLLIWLWHNGCAAVASCDYEDSLPEEGGYKSRNIPWPGDKEN